MTKLIQLNEKDISRFWRKVNKQGALWTDPETGEKSHCWEWRRAKERFGYGTLTLHHKRVRAHRASYQLEFGEIPYGMEICHKCDNPSCVNPSHLFLGTRQDNAKDMVAKGRHGLQSHPEYAARGFKNGKYTHPEKTPRGEQNGYSKLTAHRVISIRQRHTNGETPTALAKEHGVSRCAISAVVHRRNWKHI